MTPLDFLTETNFKQRVDLTVPGMAQDCAECHVGGGPMEYVPNPVMANRVPLREITTAVDVNGFGGPINASKWTAFNKFIDTYDVDNDGDKTEALNMNWKKTGVLEMDCLLCHLKGYDYDARTAMLRAAKFDASRSVGAGIAAPNDVPFATDGYGTQVTYNSMVDQPLGGNATFSSDIAMNIKASPPSENCAFCHFNFPGVDWKKRGDNWKKENDAHWVVQCMGCHQGKVGTVIAAEGDPSSSELGGAANTLPLGQCDPAKGHEPYSGLQNAKDDSIKTCEDCHLRAGYDSGLSTYSPDYGAPDPTGKHMAYGLLGEICQTGVIGGTPDATHLDVVHCTACHVRKIADEDWNTGGAIVDATGVDAAGRQADHENDYVLRSVKENLAYQWLLGKVVPTGVLTTLYWRDNSGSVDVNNDGNLGGQDVPLTTHVTAVNEGMGWSAMSHDLSGTMGVSDFTTRITQLNTDLPGINGQATTPDIRLCAMAVPFVVTHNVSPAVEALGHECADCHSSSSQGLWNEDYRLQGDDMDLTINGYNQDSPQAMRMSAGGDFHPNLKGKTGIHIVVDVLADGNLTNVNRSQILYAEDLNGTITSVHDTVVADTRDEWIDYLNNDITADARVYPDANVTVTGAFAGPYPHGYGVGCNATTEDNCQMVWDMYNVTIFHSATFTADDVGDGATYRWDFNDGTGYQTGISVPHTFNSLGIKKVTLTVVDAYGIADAEMVEINVTRHDTPAP